MKLGTCDLPFMKMHGLGNDFVVIDRRERDLAVTPDIARALGDRRLGVGFDQLAVIDADPAADARLTFWNADGSPSATCGNATRCIARHLMGEGRSELRLATERGVLAALDAGDGLTSVNMGLPILDWRGIPLARDVPLDHLPIEGDPVATGMGNPHCTFFVDDVAAVDLPAFGALHEHHPLYPERTNVQVAQLDGPDRLRVRVWERGAGVTTASGSSSCAVAVAAHRRGLTGRAVRIDLDGGTLRVDWREDGVWTTGPTAHVFDGVLTAAMLESLRMTAPVFTKPVFSNHGCRLNAYETEAMKALAAEAGIADAVIVNTCAVTAEAVRKARQDIRRLRRQHPEARIVVTGCAAQTDPEGFAAMAEVDRVVGNAEKMSPATWATLAPDFTGPTERVQVDDIMSVTETAGHLIDGFGTRARAYVQVQNGCDHRCTFCIIPYGRGNSRSVPAGVVVDQVRRLAAAGYAEVVLTGVDLTSWGDDLPARPRLGDLVLRILKLVPELSRLRISSIDSIEVDDALMRAIAEEERLMPHLHLSLQHGSDLILKRMKRRHSRGDAIAFCEAARRLRPDMTFGADVIAGFPTETEAQFAETLGLVGACDLTWLHVFPYSARPGTPAARMPQVDGRAVRERAARLRTAGEAASAAHLKAQVGRVHEVLTESPRMGRTPHFAEARFDTDQPVGRIVTARIDTAATAHLTATPVGGGHWTFGEPRR